MLHVKMVSVVSPIVLIVHKVSCFVNVGTMHVNKLINPLSA